MFLNINPRLCIISIRLSVLPGQLPTGGVFLLFQTLDQTRRAEARTGLFLAHRGFPMGLNPWLFSHEWPKKDNNNNNNENSLFKIMKIMHNDCKNLKHSDVCNVKRKIPPFPSLHPTLQR